MSECVNECRLYQAFSHCGIGVVSTGEVELLLLHCSQSAAGGGEETGGAPEGLRSGRTASGRLLCEHCWSSVPVIFTHHLDWCFLTAGTG